MFSIGETRWRMLRRFLKLRGKSATFKEMRNYCQYHKDVRFFAELVALGCLECVKPHTGRKAQEQGQWLLTPFGKKVADMGMVEWNVYLLLRPKPKKKPKVLRAAI